MVTFEEMLKSSMYIEEALMNILERKGILKREEVLEEIKKLRLKMSKSASST